MTIPQATAILTTKWIRELRMGFPKVGKTKNVVETYPTPSLLINLEPGGPDSVAKPIIYWKVDDLLKAIIAKESFGDNIHCVDLSTIRKGIAIGVTVPFSAEPALSCIKIVNALLDHCPFKTVILDPYTNWDSAINSFIASGSMGLLNEMKGSPGVKIMAIPQWGLARDKKKEFINNFTTLPCHVVFIGHVAPEKDELLGTITIMPTVTGKFQAEIGAMFSQVVVAAKEGSGDSVKYVVYTQDQANFKNLGQRFSISTKSVCGPSFKDLYGETK